MEDQTLYTQIFDAVRDPLMVVDAAGDVHAANASAIRFLDVAQDAGLFDTSSENTAADAGVSIVGNGVIDLVRRRLVVRSHALFARDGRDLGIVVDVEPLPGSAALLHFRSPTERLARELWADDAVAAVAHEIKNPLAAMRSALDVVLKDPATPLSEPHRRMLGAFDRSARRLARFVDGVLNVSRLHAGAANAPRAQVAVRDLVEAVVEEYRALHPHRCPHIECRVSDDANVFVDRDGAEIVLLNLIGNAARFSRDGDVVTVRATRAGVESMEDDVRLAPWDVLGRPQLVRIDVEDRGLGMTPDVLAHLFDRYHGGADAESVTSFVAASGAGGTHLGLHISRAIAEAHDGWLRVESSLGEGTIASVFIPEDEATARVLSRLRMASDSARRWRRAGRDLAVVALAKASAESWDELTESWRVVPRIDPVASTCESRRALLWTIDDDLAVAILPLAGREDDPSSTLGDPVIRADEFAWGMPRFVVGWCRLEESDEFAQSLHRAATRMGRACAHFARGESAAPATTPTTPEELAGDWVEAIAILPARETTLHVENQE